MFKGLSKNVVLLGFVSLFNDISSEMLYPIFPIFLTQVLGAPVFILGIIEGSAEGLSSIFKTGFGYWSDRIQRRKPFVVSGYAASSVSKAIIAFSYSWPFVFFGRFLDRLGKGTRTSARDAMLLDASNDNNKGFIFGFHRALDSAGAVIGPAIALVLLFVFHNNIRLILYWTIIPGFLSLLFFFFIKEAKKKIIVVKTSFSTSIKGFSSQFYIFLAGISLFSLASTSNTFIILRAQSLGLSLVLVIGAYILYNLTYALLSTPAGKISDIIGQKKVFIVGVIIFILVYLGFAFNKNPILIWPLFAIYGFYIALTDGVSKALIGSFVKKEESGTAYGVVNTVTSVFTFLSSAIGGLLWTIVSPESTFIFAALCAAVSLIIFLFIKENRVSAG